MLDIVIIKDVISVFSTLRVELQEATTPEFP
jgi:hypothetical protein